MPEVWGGIECTVNRIGDRFHDQVERSGHSGRVDDIDRIADLGIARVRYPMLWERLMPHVGQPPQWHSADAHLRRMRDRGVAPIATLVHHGSGPRHTNLLDPAFPDALANYARLVAEQYPWIDMWTPVNEPVSTARFSGLYGHWYPHEKRDDAFVQILFNECRGIIKAMQAIRQVIPGAQYFHTDDAGVITSSPELAYQAAFENERQLIALELMAGRVDAEHPFWPYLRCFGVQERELQWFRENSLLPDVIAGDYYITSDRHLDLDMHRHPAYTHSGNGKHVYADVAAADLDGWTPGFESMLQRLWQRYDRPVAVGEVHIDGPREAQLRWSRECWNGAVRAADTGVPVRAVTFWALLGSFDWSDLCRSERGHYETGAFDIRGLVPRPTAVAGAIRSLANTGTFSHPVLADSDLWYSRGAVRDGNAPVGTMRAPLLILGARGTLGRALVKQCHERGIAFVAMGRDELDVTRAADANSLIAALKPWAVINASGFVSVDQAELEPERCRAINVLGAGNIAHACERADARLVSFSSDLVFDGQKASPYVESDLPSPLSVYGRSKLDGEIAVQQHLPEALVVRTSAFFGTDDDYNFVVQTLRRLAAGEAVPTSGAVVSPTHVISLADSVLDLLIDGAGGMWHLSSAARISWTDFARTVANHAGLDSSLVYEANSKELAWRGVRPDYSALGTERGQTLPDFHASLAACVATWQHQLALTA